MFDTCLQGITCALGLKLLMLIIATECLTVSLSNKYNLLTMTTTMNMKRLATNHEKEENSVQSWSLLILAIANCIDSLYRKAQSKRDRMHTTEYIIERE
jgi:hypothetical protein